MTRLGGEDGSGDREVLLVLDELGSTEIGGYTCRFEDRGETGERDWVGVWEPKTAKSNVKKRGGWIGNGKERARTSIYRDPLHPFRGRQ